jgi:hypothetical protein
VKPEIPDNVIEVINSQILEDFDPKYGRSLIADYQLLDKIVSKCGTDVYHKIWKHLDVETLRSIYGPAGWNVDSKFSSGGEDGGYRIITFSKKHEQNIQGSI